MKSALADSKFSTEKWTAIGARRWIEEQALLPDLARFAQMHHASLSPVRMEWLVQRLTQMGLAFGHEKNPAKAQAWMQETARLLSDLPEDILSTAIDQAIQRSECGFLPSVGEIRLIADPFFAERKREAVRLTAVLELDQPAKAKPAPTEYCDPAAAAAILAEFGLASDKDMRAADRVNLGPPRKPTPAELQDIAAAMGVEPATGEGLAPCASIAGLTIAEIFAQRDRRAGEALRDEGFGGHFDDGDGWRAVA